MLELELRVGVRIRSVERLGQYYDCTTTADM